MALGLSRPRSDIPEKQNARHLKHENGGRLDLFLWQQIADSLPLQIEN